jgi:hypothetical protein
MKLQRLVTLHDDGGLRLAVMGDVFINAWMVKQVDLASMNQLIRAQKALNAQRRNEPYGILSLVDATRTLKITDDAKERSRVHEKEMQPYVVGLSQVVVGGGFVAAAARTVLTTISLLNRPPYPIKVFSTVRDGVRFLGTRVELDQEALTAAAEKLLA